MTNLNIQGEGVITSVTFRQDGRHIIGGSGLGTVRKWGTADGREVGRIMTVGVEVGAVATSRDGLWIVGGTTVGSAIIWNGTTYEKVIEIKSAHVDWVLSVDISPDSKTFATGSYDETAVVWELGTGLKLFGLRHPSHVGGVRFSPSGDRLATATWGDLSAICIFGSRSGELLIRIPNAVSSVSPNPLAWSDNGQRIFASYKVSINQFDVATTSHISGWKVDPHIHVQLIALANSGQFIVCSIDRTVTIWDTLTHTTICSPIRLTGRLKSIAISLDDTRIAFGQDDDRIVLRSLPDILPRSYFVSRGPPIIVSEISRWNMNLQLRSAIRPLMHVSDIAFESWMQGKLGNAESMFTQEIIRSSNHDHHHALANRALIRARSKRWRDATDDAEKSIKIQPSAIALVAKSLALVGDGKTIDGYRACDSAIAQSTSNDTQFLRVIKSIIFCMAEESEETIPDINNLVAMMDDQSIYYFIQAQLYFWFGDLQSSRGEYQRAAESFKHAQLPTQSLENPYLTTMSLVFGWNFEDLSFNVQRALCEALCKADSPKEAIETLHKLTNGFGEARPSQSTAEWIMDFTQRCVLALDRAGDVASDSYDHEKAAVHYALALLNGQTFSNPILRKWVNAKLTNNNSWREVLRTAVEFTTSRIAIYQAICEVLAGCGSLSEAAECFRTMTNDVEREIAAGDEYDHWVLDFKHRCGDVAMQLRQYDAAIEYYSAAISLQPLNIDAFIKRSRAREAKGLLDDALCDTDEAMELDPSRPSVYETKHAVLRGAKRYDEAIAVFESMLTMIEQSSDSQISQLRNNYVSTSETSAAVDITVDEIQKHCPLILIDVHTGELCDAPARMRIFKSDPTSKELISSMTKKLDKERIRNVVAGFLKYVMFSHVWTRPEEGQEPSLQDVNEVQYVWALSATQPNEKLRNFCKKTRSLGFRWAWSDTCCIDKLSNVILDQSLTSMYKWYENSAATLVLLVNVEHPSKRGDLPFNLWMIRAWTLQELLAPKVILFYDSTWKPYLGDGGTNHKESPEIMQELADAIKISSRTIIAFQPNSLTVREKLRLASKRNATREEDVAYCLIGIFESDVRPRYGEGYAALGHLLDEIVTRSGAVTVLDWIGKSSIYNTCLPASLSVYSEAPHTPPALEAEEMEASIARLGSALARNEAVRFYTTIKALQDASFTRRRLSLPCVIFQTDSLQVHDVHHSSEKEYGAEVPGLGHVNVVTADILSQREARRLFFVHPWIHRIRGHETGFNVTSLPTSSSYGGPFPQVSEYTQALELIARLEQPFNALLLLQQEDGKYRRVATEHAIVVKPEITSLADVRVETLQIL